MLGWHQSMSAYALQIRELIAKMFAILPKILPANSAAINYYLNCLYVPITTLEASVNECHDNSGLQARFKTYVDKEEARLKANLEAVNYDIDALDTLVLITGPGRIERVTPSFISSFRLLIGFHSLSLSSFYRYLRYCSNITSRYSGYARQK